MDKSSNIVRWVTFGVLAFITVALAGLFYLGISGVGIPEDVRKDPAQYSQVMAQMTESRTSMILLWAYILAGLGLLVVVFSVIFAAVVKGLNWKTLLIAIAAFLIIGAVAVFLSKDSFSIPFMANGVQYKGTDHGVIESALNFFYITFGVSVVAILFSVIYSAVKK